MQIEEDIAQPDVEFDLPALEEMLAARLSANVKSIRVVYRRDYSVHAMVVRWLFGAYDSRLYELLIEISFPYATGETLWPFTLEEEMDLLEGIDERWDVERVFVTRTTPRKQTGTVVLRRYRSRMLVS